MEVAWDRTLDDYAALARLAEPVAELRSEATKVAPPLVYDGFLVLQQLRKWGRLFTAIAPG